MATSSNATAAPQSAGQVALDTLFPQGSTEGQAAVLENPTPNGAGAQPEIGDHGKLGELPPDGKPQPTANEDGSTQAPAAEANWLEFAVTDEAGRRKMKVDLNDREKLARLLPQAAGFRKMQAERDAHAAKVKSIEPRLKELETNWQTLETAYQEGGIEGLVDLLGGKKGHYGEWFKGEYEKHSRYVGATAAEKHAMDLERQLTTMQKQQEAREKRIAESEKKAATDREEAQLRSIEAQVTPVFNKYRFAGNVEGMNPDQAAAFDQAIWDQALAKLEQLPEDQPLTPALIEKEFRTVSTAFRAAIGKVGTQKAKQVIDNKKQAAGQQVVAAVTRTSGNALDASMAKDIQRGGVAGLTDGLLKAVRGFRG